MVLAHAEELDPHAVRHLGLGHHVAQHLGVGLRAPVRVKGEVAEGVEAEFESAGHGAVRRSGARKLIRCAIAPDVLSIPFRAKIARLGKRLTLVASNWYLSATASELS